MSETTLLANILPSETNARASFEPAFAFYPFRRNREVLTAGSHPTQDQLGSRGKGEPDHWT